MNTKEREKALAKIRKFVDSVEEVDGKIRFDTMDGISAIYSMAVVVLDMKERMDMTEAQSNDYDTRNRKFAGLYEEDI